MRPQSILLIVTPLDLGDGVSVARHASGSRRRSSGCFAASAVLANTHLLFPIAAAPCVLLLDHTRRPIESESFSFRSQSRSAGSCLAVRAALARGIRLNFAPNALFGPPTRDQRVQARLPDAGDGGERLARALIAVHVRCHGSWRRDWMSRARVLYGLLWLAGLLMFALAVRSLVVWWLLTIPLCVALALSICGRRRFPSCARRSARSFYVIFALVRSPALETWQDPALRAGRHVLAIPSVDEREVDRAARAVARLQHAPRRWRTARHDVQLRRLRPVAAAVFVGIDRRASDFRRLGFAAGDVFRSRPRERSRFSRGERRIWRSSRLRFRWPRFWTRQGVGAEWR